MPDQLNVLLAEAGIHNLKGGTSYWRYSNESTINSLHHPQFVNPMAF